MIKQDSLSPEDGIRIAVIDLNNNTPNEGMRCIRLMLEWQSTHVPVPFVWQEFDPRYKNEVPDDSFDIYISSGGPGSPFDDEGTEWEQRYFGLCHQLLAHNLSGAKRKKYFFFICHSFQLMCRCFGIGQISKRKAMAFGVAQVSKTPSGLRDPLLKGLPTDFFVADFRNFQVLLDPYEERALPGFEVLTREKQPEATNHPLAITAVRICPEMVGTQFHPEADPEGMKLHFQKPEKKQMIIEKYGEDRFKQLISRFDDPEKIGLTHKTILPNFITHATAGLLSTGITLADPH